MKEHSLNIGTKTAFIMLNELCVAPCERTFPKHRDENIKLAISDNAFLLFVVKEHSLNIGTKTRIYSIQSVPFHVCKLVKEHSLNIGTKTRNVFRINMDQFAGLHSERTFPKHRDEN